MKLVIINALTLLIGLGLMSGSFSQRNAAAARFETAPALQINKLGNYRGQYLTVYYAIGSRPFISTNDSQIKILQVKESRNVRIAGDSLKLPAVQIEKEGFRPAYNLIVVVISSTADFSWKNADGSLPHGITKTNNQNAILVNAINKMQIENTVDLEKHDALFTIDLSH